MGTDFLGIPHLFGEILSFRIENVSHVYLTLEHADPDPVDEGDTHIPGTKLHDNDFRKLHLEKIFESCTRRYIRKCCWLEPRTMQYSTSHSELGRYSSQRYVFS